MKGCLPRDIKAILVLVVVPAALVAVSACGGIDAAAEASSPYSRRIPPPVADKSVTEICTVQGCNCTDEAGAWMVVNCTFNDSQKVELVPGSVPSNILEMSIIGGDVLTVNPLTFNQLKGLSLLRVDGTKNFIVHRHAFFNLTSHFLVMQVQYCDKFVLESNAFKNMQTSITAEISNCNHVTIKNSGFSRLQTGRFDNIASLSLEENTFSFENQGQIGRHGPVTILSFNGVKILEVPKRAFISSLDKIVMNKCEIKNIDSEAFSSNQISEVVINETTISRMKRGAFSERTLICNFLLNNSKINIMESSAVLAAITNLTVTNNTITEIHEQAVTSTTASVTISNNKIKTVHQRSFVLNDFNRLIITDNILTSVGRSFVNITSVEHLHEFRFVGNQIFNARPGSLSFVPKLFDLLPASVFDHTLFNQTCHCTLDKWLEELLENEKVFYVLNTSFCVVDPNLLGCFKIELEPLINMENFTEIVCVEGEDLVCEAYNGETKVLDTTATMLFDEVEENPGTGLMWGVLLGFLLIMAVSGTIVILLIKWGIWMKKKGYCVHFRDRLNQTEQSFDDERDMVEQEPYTIEYEEEEGEDLDRLKELLDRLKKEIESPDDDVRLQAENEIQRLYEQFGTTNNNRQEEMHLYEELGVLQKPKENQRRPVVVDYSEPTDAAVHLYSELKTKEEDEKKSSVKSNSAKSNSVKSNASKASGKMAMRPLPEKPSGDDAPGPSTKY